MVNCGDIHINDMRYYLHSQADANADTQKHMASALHRKTWMQSEKCNLNL